MLLLCLERKQCSYLSEIHTQRFSDDEMISCLDLLQNNNGKAMSNE